MGAAPPSPGGATFLLGPGLGCRANSVSRVDFQPWMIDLDFQVVAPFADRGSRQIAQRVLVAHVGSDIRVRIFDRVAREPGVDLPASGSRRVFGQQIAVAL